MLTLLFEYLTNYNAFVLSDDDSIKLGPSAYTISDREVDEEDLDSDAEDEPQTLAAIRMAILESGPPPSSYYSSSSDEEQSGHASPMPDDTNSNTQLSYRQISSNLHFHFCSIPIRSN